MSKQTAVRVPDELNERLAALAKRTGRPVARFVREAIKEHIDELEACYTRRQ